MLPGPTRTIMFGLAGPLCPSRSEKTGSGAIRWDPFLDRKSVCALMARERVMMSVHRVVAYAACGILGISCACVAQAQQAQATPAPINPTTKALIDDIRMFQMWVYGFENDGRKKALPGDFDKASGTLKCKPQPCRNGNGNGVIEGQWNSLSSKDESFLVWSHLAASGTRKGPSGWQSESPADPYVPKNILGGRVGLTSLRAGQQPISGMRGSFVGCTAGIPLGQVMEIERLLDDGQTDRGGIQAVPDDSAPGARPYSASAQPGAAQADAKFTVCLAW